MINGDYILVKAPEKFPGKKYRNKYCYEHHLVYWENTGKVPTSSEIIHHLNGNKHDNTFENLILLSKHEHNTLHFKSRGKHLVELKCPNCNKIFVIERRKSFLIRGGKSTFCSKKCLHSFLTIKDKKEKEKRIKENFIKEYIGIL